MHIQTPQNVNTIVQQYPDVKFRKKFHGKQGRISYGRFQ